jgi:hypothetical protein
MFIVRLCQSLLTKENIRGYMHHFDAEVGGLNLHFKDKNQNESSMLPRNRLSSRYINIATTSIQQFESKGMLGQQQNMPKKKEITTKAK